MNAEVFLATSLVHGWRLVLAFSAGTVCVALLRRPCRQLFGALRAYQLWVLPALAMVASQWPHETTNGANGALPALVYMITLATPPPSFHAGAAESFRWPAVILFAWVPGVLLVAWSMVRGQRRYRDALRGATVVVHEQSLTPLLRAIRPDVGPALVGAWRPRIVIPADFDSRYDAAERTLIIAHERTHARRGDGFGCLVAQVLLVLFWFNPLAWWAVSALRHDQEFACDAAVLAQLQVSPRLYANAMLKAQSSALDLPVGCSWSPRHPITERIAMLKQTPLSPLRARLGLFVGLVLGTIVSGVVYAASQPFGPIVTPPSVESAAGEYQLDIMVASYSKGRAADHAGRTTGGICMKAGEAGGVNTDAWQLGAKVVSLNGGRISVALDLRTANGTPMASHTLEGRLGQPLLAEFNGAVGEPSISVHVTAVAGCPARVWASAR